MHRRDQNMSSLLTSGIPFLAILILSSLATAQPKTCQEVFSTSDLPRLQVPTVNGTHYNTRYSPPSLLGYKNPYIALRLDGQQSIDLVAIANQQYIRRGWSPEFLTGLEKTARDYKDRTIGYKIEREPYGTAPQTTIAMTYAKFTKAEIESGLLGSLFKNGDELTAQDRVHILPEEEKLRRVLTRYYDSRGNGILLEFRTNSKVHDAPEVLSEIMLVEEVRMALEAIEDYPELYDKPVVKSYGNKTSIRHLGRLGFTVETAITPLDKPIEMVDSEGHTDLWWALEASPMRLEQNLFKLRHDRGHTIENLNIPYPVQISENETIYAKPHTTIKFGDNKSLESIILDREAEVTPGIFASAGAHVTWISGHIHKISSTSGQSRFSTPEGEFAIPPGSILEFIGSAKPTIRTIQNYNSEIVLSKLGLKALPRFQIFLTPSRGYDSVVGMRAYISQNVYFSDGAIAAKGQALQVDWNGSRYDWTDIVLAEDAVIDGVQYRVGNRLSRSASGAVRQIPK